MFEQKPQELVLWNRTSTGQYVFNGAIGYGRAKDFAAPRLRLRAPDFFDPLKHCEKVQHWERI